MKPYPTCMAIDPRLARLQTSSSGSLGKSKIMITVGGENLIDLVQISEGKGLPEFRALPGGSQFNCASALGRLGTRPHYITPISTDSMGKLLADALLESGVVVASDRIAAPSSLAVVTLSDGQPSYQFYRDGTAERLVESEQLKALVPTRTKVFQIGSLSLCNGDDADVWAGLFTDLAQQGIACTLDPNVRAGFVTDPAAYRHRIERMMAVAAMVKLSDEDLGWLYPDADAEDMVMRLAAGSQARLFVLTKGSAGATLITPSCRIEVEAAPVTKLQDTVGAGDTFMAALIYQFLHAPDFASEATVRDVGRFAAKAAAINCERVGCNPPTLDEIQI